MKNTIGLQPWKPGQSGNPKGRPKKLIPRVDEILAKQKINPVDEILALMPQLKPRDQAEIWLQLIAYCQAKPQKSEVDPDPLEEMPTPELLALVKKHINDFEKSA